MEEFIKEITKTAGDKLNELFGVAKIVHTKAKVTDIVTEADLASQEILVTAIKKHYPDHGVVSEESEDYNTNADYVWYIDPLDGTKNFASGVQIFGINLAVTLKGDLQYAAIILPALSELCYAEKGKGSWLNDKKVSCSEKQDWVGSYGIGPVKVSPKTAKFQEALNELSGDTAWTNGIACTAASGVWMAAGKRDWYVGTSSNSWDYAAPALMAKEAGCVVQLCRRCV